MSQKREIIEVEPEGEDVVHKKVKQLTWMEEVLNEIKKQYPKHQEDEYIYIRDICNDENVKELDSSAFKKKYIDPMMKTMKVKMEEINKAEGERKNTLILECLFYLKNLLDKCPDRMRDHRHLSCILGYFKHFMIAFGMKDLPDSVIKIIKETEEEEEQDLYDAIGSAFEGIEFGSAVSEEILTLVTPGYKKVFGEYPEWLDNTIANHEEKKVNRAIKKLPYTPNKAIDSYLLLSKSECLFEALPKEAHIKVVDAIIYQFNN